MPELKKYVFRPYSDRIPVLFRREKASLRRVLCSKALIEHCGSTAVPGLGGKGILDIYVSVEKKSFDKSKKALIEAGFKFHPENGDKYRLFFVKDYIYSGKIRRVHLHLTFDENISFREAVCFVKYMKKHPEALREYVSVKKKAVRYCKGKVSLYKKYKHNFIVEVTRKALKEFDHPI
jgi:GrpB-like predicted nucleotidyltransferase (UPF0157 family)